MNRKPTTVEVPGGPIFLALSDEQGKMIRAIALLGGETVEEVMNQILSAGVGAICPRARQRWLASDDARHVGETSCQFWADRMASNDAREMER